MQETEFKIIKQGDVAMSHNYGYMLQGGFEQGVVCFYIDPIDRAYVSASMQSENDCPVVFISNDDDQGIDTQIEFVDFPGFRFHAGGAGKSIAIALVNRFK